jgi:DNA mismatch repair protein MutL
MLVRDNGKGIDKSDLALALRRHATSKIEALDDLDQICSLGFRGEALASVCAVSRLTLTSRANNQAQAWQAHTEGKQMETKLQPAAHPEGTSIEVLDLFYNTPARRRFLRAEKTEFQHIDEVFKAISLSRFDVAFSLQHNHRQVRKLPAVVDKQSPLRRLIGVLGKEFGDHSMELCSQHDHMQLNGWISLHPVQLSEKHYIYVNGRIMRDKLIRHALNQALEQSGLTGQSVSCVLYLNLPSDEVDVNVHPAKQEVRFRQTRLVHDFILSAITSALQASQQKDIEEVSGVAEQRPNHSYIQPLKSHSAAEYPDAAPSHSHHNSNVQGDHLRRSNYHPANSLSHRASIITQRFYNQAITDDLTHSNSFKEYLVIGKRHIFIPWQQQYYLLPFSALLACHLDELWKQQKAIAQPLLMPVALKWEERLKANYHSLHIPLKALGIVIAESQNNCLLRMVPSGLRQLPWISIFPRLLTEYSEKVSVQQHCIDIIATSEIDLDSSEQQQLIHHLQDCGQEDIQVILSHYGKKVPFADWIADYAQS